MPSATDFIILSSVVNERELITEGRAVALNHRMDMYIEVDWTTRGRNGQ